MPDGSTFLRSEKPTQAPGLSLADLDRMSAEWAESMVRRDVIWPNPDWKALVAGGMDPRAAAMVKGVRERMPARPPYGVRQLGLHHSDTSTRSDEAVRRDYVEMMTLVRDHLMACRSADEVRGARAAILKAAEWHPRCSTDIRHRVMSIWRDNRFDTIQVDYRDAIKAEHMVRNGWPGAPAPRRRAPAEEGAAKGAPMPQRPVIADPVREGMPPRRIGEVSLVSFLDQFGLRAVEFGKGVPQGERAAFLERTWDSLEDLADLLGIPPQAIGLDGTLSLAFSTRRVGGAADYQPADRTMALSRSGCGALAKCWALAFDHWCGDPDGSAPGSVPRTASGPADRRRTALLTNPVLQPVQAAAWAALDAAIWRDDPASHLEMGSAQAEIARVERLVAETEAQRAALSDACRGREPSAEEAEYLSSSAEWVAGRRNEDLPSLRRTAAAAALRDEAAGESRYAREARRLSNREGDSWVNPTHVFARAFEACVWEMLGERGGRSDHLVHSAEAERFAEGFRGNPYPAGTDRLRILAAARATIAAMAPSMTSGGPAFLSKETLDEEIELAKAPSAP